MKSLRPSPPCCFKQLGEGASSYEPHQQALGKRRFQRWPAGRWGGLLPLRSALLKTARGAFLFHFRDVASGSTGGSIGCDDVATASRHCSSALTGFVTALVWLQRGWVPSPRESQRLTNAPPLSSRGSLALPCAGRSAPPPHAVPVLRPGL
jgi:hypothetical protein